MTDLPRDRKSALAGGFKSYFTSKPCKYGHVSERWSASAKCKACHYRDNPVTKVKVTIEQKKASAKERGRRWYEANKEITKARAAQWKKENPEAIARWDRKFRKTTEGKTIRFMRDSIRRCMVNKTDRTEKLLGYTKADLINHIESLFTSGMSWDNHGDWHIDHIVPVSWFVKAGVNDPRVVNKLGNLRPLWASENQKRNRKYV